MIPFIIESKRTIFLYCQAGNTPQTDPQIEYHSCKTLASFCAQIDNLILKFIWKCKESKLPKTILKKNKVDGLFFPILKPTIKLQ
jgi:hypothetical protein